MQIIRSSDSVDLACRKEKKKIAKTYSPLVSVPKILMVWGSKKVSGLQMGSIFIRTIPYEIVF
jgi:hypothetical protein